MSSRTSVRGGAVRKRSLLSATGGIRVACEGEEENRKARGSEEWEVRGTHERSKGSRSPSKRICFAVRSPRRYTSTAGSTASSGPSGVVMNWSAVAVILTSGGVSGCRRRMDEACSSRALQRGASCCQFACNSLVTVGVHGAEREIRRDGDSPPHKSESQHAPQ